MYYLFEAVEQMVKLRPHLGLPRTCGLCHFNNFMSTTEYMLAIIY